MSENGSPDTKKTVPKRPEVRFYVSLRLWKYLEWVGRHSVLGEDPNEVAERILVQRLAEMRQEDYKPPDKL